MGVGCKVLEKKQFYITKPSLKKKKRYGRRGKSWQVILVNSIGKVPHGIASSSTWLVFGDCIVGYWLLTTHHANSAFYYSYHHTFYHEPLLSTQEKKNLPFPFFDYLFIYLFIYFCPPNSFVSNSPTQRFFFN
jgi:hypothetical protein